MKDIFTQIHELKRNPLLVRAARFGVDDYQRERHLRRSLKFDKMPSSGEALMRLLEVEREMNDARIAGNGNYTIAHHVEILIAIMGEAQVLRATSRATLVE
jgi:hypothetical protein